MCQLPAKMEAEIDTLCFLAQSKEVQQNQYENKKKNNQYYKKIKLYESPTTKKLKKKHSSRPVGGAEG